MSDSLDYLDFEYSEDGQGIGTFDAMASTTQAQQTAAVRAEVARVLAWAHDHFPGARGPLDEEGEWDYDLQSVQEYAVQDQIDYDEETQQLQVRPGVPGVARHTLSVSVSGTATFCAAFRQVFVRD